METQQQMITEKGKAKGMSKKISKERGIHNGQADWLRIELIIFHSKI